MQINEQSTTLGELAQLKDLLDHFNPTDRDDQLNYFRLLHEVGEEALEELRPRMQKAITDRAFRLLIMETAYYYPWLAWIEPLARMLRHEPDLEVFEAGVRSLVHMHHAIAMHALKELCNIRHAPAFQMILSKAITESEPPL